jgi:hypothetical protein
MFFPGSRYSTVAQFTVTRSDGMVIQTIRSPLPEPALMRGYYRRVGGQRLDQIASRFVADATAFWQLCDANNTVVPDSLANQDLVGIPLNAPGAG